MTRRVLVFASTLSNVGDGSLAAMRVVGETLHSGECIYVIVIISNAGETHCALADVEVVEHEEGRQVSQLLGTYGAANECARSLPRLRISLSTWTRRWIAKYL